LGERLLCKQEVAGSIPAGSTLLFRPNRPGDGPRMDHLAWRVHGNLRDLFGEGQATTRMQDRSCRSRRDSQPPTRADIAVWGSVPTWREVGRVETGDDRPMLPG
jgi:hypothetical protein